MDKKIKEGVDKILLSFAKRLHKSRRYEKTKEFVRDTLTNQASKYKKILDSFIIFLIISSVLILIYEVKNPIPSWLEFYDIYIVSMVFLLEYLARLWIHNDIHKDILKADDESKFLNKNYEVWKIFLSSFNQKLSYAITPPAIVDLLAIFPAYRPLRVLRVFILFRFLKLLRYTNSINQFVEVLANKKFELLTLLMLLFFVVSTGGIALYVLEESQNDNIRNIFDAFYWSLITVSTVGYGDISPVTHAGRVISMMLIIVGIGMISFATSVIVSAFSEKLDELKESRIIDEINKSREFLIICGYGQLTKMFLRQTKNRGESLSNYIILDKDPQKVQEALHDGYRAIVEDASKHTTLEKFNTKNANVTLLCMLNDDIENIYITLNAKSINKDITVIARATNENVKKKYKRAGADFVLLPSEVAGSMMAVAILKPLMYRVINTIFIGKHSSMLEIVTKDKDEGIKLNEEDYLVDEVHIFKDSKIRGLRIGDLNFKKFKLILFGIEKSGQNFIFNPSRDITIEEGDILLVFGHHISIEYFKDISYMDKS
jgi:voltage-gated potassium channel